jgi:cytoskeletal protein CcmA (bactofilin family)
LSVTNGTSLGGNLSVAGNVTSAAFSSHNATIDNLHANNTILNGNLTVTGNISGNTLSVTKGTSLGGNLSVAGNVTSAAISSHNATLDNLHANNTTP